MSIESFVGLEKKEKITQGSDIWHMNHVQAKA